MWDVDYISKQLYEAPWSPLAIDWISEHANGTYRHYAEPRHATEAITSAAQVGYMYTVCAASINIYLFVIWKRRRKLCSYWVSFVLL
jgi:hypothetical protein